MPSFATDYRFETLCSFPSYVSEDFLLGATVSNLKPFCFHRLLPLTDLGSGDVTQSHAPAANVKPSTQFTCSGNIMWLLWYPWQQSPADALDLGSFLMGWLACMDEAWALPWLALSAPGMGSSSPLQKTQLAACPSPIMLTPAVFHMTGLVLQDTETILVQRTSEPECPAE